MAGKHLQLTDELQEQASLFAAGALPESERREYARHLEEDDCAICQNEAREFMSTANLLIFRGPLESPSPKVKQRLMEQVRAGATTRRASVAKPRRWLEWTAGLTAVAASAALVFVLSDNVQLRQLTDSLSNRIAQLEAQLGDQRIRFAALTSPDVRVVNLAGQGENAKAAGRIFWDQSKRRWLFYVQNLAQAPSDKSYQLWFVPKTGNPLSATVFNTTITGSAEIEIQVPESIDELKAAAVTTEPVGGVPQPTGAFALLGLIE